MLKYVYGIGSWNGKPLKHYSAHVWSVGRLADKTLWHHLYALRAVFITSHEKGLTLPYIFSSIPTDET